MKAAIAAEVARKELADDIKRGPGGIREIEFLVQALQLIRGGREPALRERRLLPALAALVARRAGRAGRGHRAGRCLSLPAPPRKPPADAARRADARVAGRPTSIGTASRAGWVRRLGGLARGARRAPRYAWPPNSKRCSRRADARAAPSDLATYWRALPDAGDAQALVDAGFRDIENPRRQPARFRARAGRAHACPTRRARGSIACCRRCSPPPRVHRNPMRRCVACCRCCTPCCVARVISPCSTNNRRRSRGWSMSCPAARCWPNASPRIRCCSMNCSTAARRRVARSRRARGRVHGDLAATTTPKPR